MSDRGLWTTGPSGVPPIGWMPPHPAACRTADPMRNLIDFSSWSTLLTTLMGLLVATLVMVGTRLVFMQTIQKRRERENRQINERLKTLIAAYKTLGGSFTGQLQVSPTHI